MTFLGQQSAGNGHQHRYQTEDSSGDGVLVLLRAAYPCPHRTKGEERDEAHRVRTYHTEGRELVLLVIIVGHHVEQRTVRHVDHRVAGHHEQVERVGPYTLAHIAHFGCIEQQRKDDAKGDRAEDQPRAIRTPARLRAVGDTTHERIGHYVKHTGNEHQCGRIGEGQPKHMGEKHRESDGHNFPGDAAGSSITQSICYFFS